MITIDVNPVMSKITGVIPDKEFTILYNELSYRDQLAYFKQKYNSNIPDKKYLITPGTRVFQTGLLSRVCSILDRFGLEYQINDKRIESPPEFFMPIVEEKEKLLRPYQREAITSAVKNKCGILRMATGAGKTFVASNIVAQIERRTIILVHRLDLLEQFTGVLKSLMHFDNIIGVCGGGRFEPNIITVCTMQTIAYALGIEIEKSDEEKEVINVKQEEIIKILESAQVVVVDELHHIVAQTFAQVMKRCKNAIWRLGLTATDWRDDGADLLIEAAVGPRIFDISISDLVEKGYLVPAYVKMLKQADPKEKCHPKDNWHTMNKCYYTENNNFHQQVLEMNRVWYEQGKHILTLVTAIKHGVILEKLHNKNGIKTVFLSGSDPADYRKKIFDDMRSGKLRHLIATSIADEGVDLPILDCVNLAGGGKSSTKVYQRIGRTLRPVEGKTHAEVIDYCPSVELLAYHAKRRAYIYKTENSFHYEQIK